MDKERQVTLLKNIYPIVRDLKQTHHIIEFLRHNKSILPTECPDLDCLFEQNKNLLLTILQKDNKTFDVFYQGLLTFQPEMTWFVYTPKLRQTFRALRLPTFPGHLQKITEL